MAHVRPPTRIAIFLALVAGGASHAECARPGSAPATPARVRALDEGTYREALAGFANYHSCGVDVAAYAGLSAQLNSIEAAARAKGLGPTLDRVRQDYLNMLAVSIMRTCGGGRISALARARGAMADFQAWVTGAPAVALTPAQREGEVVRTIAALEETYAAAEIARGEAAMRRVLDEHFSAPSGPEGASAANLALLDAAARAAVYREAVTEREVSIEGDAATVNGIVAITYAAPSGAPVSRFRFTETYQSRDGIWRMVSRILPDRPLP